MLRRAFRRVSWTKELDSLLGTMSDRKLAKIIGVSGKAVFDRRRKLNVPDYESSTFEARMRQISDADLAMPAPFVSRKYGTSERSVLRERRRRKIIPLRELASPSHYPARSKQALAQIASRAILEQNSKISVNVHKDIVGVLPDHGDGVSVVLYRAAITAMREATPQPSYTVIASVLGLSKQRISQIMNSTRTPRNSYTRPVSGTCVP